MPIVEYNKIIGNTSKLNELISEQSFAAKFDRIITKDGKTCIILTTDLSSSNQTVLNDLVNNFIDFTTSEQVQIHLDENVFPFIDSIIHKFAAENIALGITQYGKTGHLLGLFEKKFDIYSNNLPISLKGSFDTGSLYESVAIITHLITNPTIFDGLSPFVTIARLTEMKDEIIDFLT